MTLIIISILIVAVFFFGYRQGKKDGRFQALYTMFDPIKKPHESAEDYTKRQILFSDYKRKLRGK